MRISLLGLLIALRANAALPALVNQTFTGSAPGTTTFNMTIASTGSGNLLLAIFGAGGPGVGKVTGITGCSGSWSSVVASEVNRATSAWINASPSSGCTTISITINSLATNWQANVSEWSALTSTSDGTNSSNGSSAPSTTLTAPSITTTHGVDLIVVCGRTSGTLTPTTGQPGGAWTNFTGFNNSTFAYLPSYIIANGAQTTSASWTFAASGYAYDAWVMALQGTGSSGAVKHRVIQ